MTEKEEILLRIKDVERLLKYLQELLKVMEARNLNPKFSSMRLPKAL